MFAYALNNPVKYADDDGEAAHIVAGTIIGAVINVAMGYASAVQSGENYSWKEAIVDGIGGAISGGLAASGVGMGMQALVGGITSVGVTFTKGVLTNNPATNGELFVAAAAGITSGLIGGDGLTCAPKVLKNIKIMNSATTSQVFAKAFNAISGEIACAQSKYMASVIVGNLFMAWQGEISDK